jgi:arylsulfatase A
MKALFLCAFLLPSLLCAEGKPPNILYILADDLGYGDVSCLNPDRGKIPTPHLDKLASEGMTFPDSHSGSSVCTPTRYGVLTGRYAWRTRLQNGVLSGYDTPLISKNTLTVPAFLKQRGYHTACIGKWHLGFTLEDGAKPGKGKEMGAPLGSTTANGPVTRGFDEYFGFHHARMMKSVFENEKVTRIVEPIDMLPLLVEHTSAHIAARAKSGEPFFIYMALNSPHSPVTPSKAWQGKSVLGAYGDFVMETDWSVGEVLAALETSGVAENTLVIFTSDNGCSGPAANTKQLEQKGHFASAGFRGYKSDIWDGGHRVPFFVRWPGKVKAGSTSTQLICHTDLMATCGEILGVKFPDNAAVDSVSMLPAFLGKDDKPLREAVVHHSIDGRFSIRQDKWKLELCPGSGGWSAPDDKAAATKGLPDIQLYDLTADPGETHNLQAGNPEVVGKLRAILGRYLAEGRSTPGPRLENDVRVVMDPPGKARK